MTVGKSADLTKVEKWLPRNGKVVDGGCVIDPVEIAKAQPQGRQVVNMENGVDFSELEKVLPPIVFRNWYRWRDVLPIAPRTVANDDSLGCGPKEKIMVGRVCGYPRNSLLDYLRSKSRVVKGGK